MQADLVFRGGPVFTDGIRHTGPVAVKDGRVVAVGDDAERCKGETIDLEGRLLLPGFQDAHVHAVMGGVELGQCDLTGTVDLDEYLRRVAAYARTIPARSGSSAAVGRWRVSRAASPPRTCSIGWSPAARST